MEVFMGFTRCDVRAMLALLLVSVILIGCSNSNSNPAAPLGEQQVLQQLADTYSRVQQDLPVNPSGLLPMGKRKFVERVFAESGYNYTATLFALATTEAKNLTPYHKDMRELLFLPHTGSRPADMHEVYSNEELAAIARIDTLFDQP